MLQLKQKVNVKWDELGFSFYISAYYIKSYNDSHINQLTARKYILLVETEQAKLELNRNIKWILN